MTDDKLLQVRIGRPYGNYYQSGVVYPSNSFVEKPGTQDYWNTIKSMLQDSQISASIGLRKRTALTMLSELEGDAEAVNCVSEVISKITFIHDIHDLLSRLEFGISYQEIIWKLDDSGKYWIDAIEQRSNKNFRWFFSETGEKFLQYYDRGTWRFAPDKKFIVGTNNATQENPYGESVLVCVYPDWVEKCRLKMYFDRLSEKLSIPSFIALTDASNQKDIDQVSTVLSEIENGAGLAVSGVRDIKELSVSNQMGSLLEKIKELDRNISKGITSQVLALDYGQTGSYALGNVHENSLKVVAAMDCDATAYLLNRQVIRWILDLNGIGGDAYYPVDALTRVKSEIDGKKQGGFEFSDMMMQ